MDWFGWDVDVWRVISDDAKSASVNFLQPFGWGRKVVKPKNMKGTLALSFFDRR